MSEKLTINDVRMEMQVAEITKEYIEWYKDLTKETTKSLDEALEYVQRLRIFEKLEIEVVE